MSIAEIRLTDRWGYRTDQYQTILVEHYMGPGGRNPRTGEYHEPRPTTRESYHPTLRAAIRAAIDREAGDCPDLDALRAMTARWEELALAIAAGLEYKAIPAGMKDLFGDEIKDPPGPQGAREVARGYAAPPGTGPEGETCGSCLFHAVKQMGKRYHKCKLVEYRWTGGIKTDIRVRSPACSRWADARGKL